jgi:hypothetical protein
MSKKQTKHKGKNAKKLTEKALDNTVGGVDLSSVSRSTKTSATTSASSTTASATRPATRIMR